MKSRFSKHCSENFNILIGLSAKIVNNVFLANQNAMYPIEIHIRKTLRHSKLCMSKVQRHAERHFDCQRIDVLQLINFI